jgi:phosphodiesterase/alkaline phosphatase D-like protein
VATTRRPVPATHRADPHRGRRGAVPAGVRLLSGHPSARAAVHDLHVRPRRCRGRRAARLRAADADASEPDWPDALLLLGDQVYADELSPWTLEHIERTRGTDVPPGKGIADFEEYTVLYREAWGDPLVRWVLSTCPTAMVFDDHDVHDDWNTSGPGGSRCSPRTGGRPASRAA